MPCRAPRPDHPRRRAGRRAGRPGAAQGAPRPRHRCWSSPGRSAAIICGRFSTATSRPTTRALVEPLIVHRWPRLRRALPRRTAARLAHDYRTIESERLDAAVRAALPAERDHRRARRPRHAEQRSRSTSGETLHAGAVLDTRGLRAAPDRARAAAGRNSAARRSTVPAGHGLDRPIVMDATVDQADGYRFVYCLPFSPTELFVEDTYYSDTPDLDPDAARAAHRRLCRRARLARRGASARQETGVLPVVIGGDFDAFWPRDRPRRARRGARRAVPSADQLLAARRGALRRLARARRPARRAARPRDARAAPSATGSAAASTACSPGCCSAPPTRPQRYRILERFYRLPEPLIGRFYAGQSTLGDRAAHPRRQAPRIYRPSGRRDDGEEVKSAIVIGSGFGGLALAIRLQSAGVADDHRRGARQARRARLLLGPRRPCVRRRPDRHHRPRLPRAAVEIVGRRHRQRCRPGPGQAVLRARLARRHALRLQQRRRAACSRRSPRSTPPTSRATSASSNTRAGVYEEGYLKLGTKAFENIGDMLKAAPALAKYQAWRSVYSIVSKFVADEHLRQALSFHTLLVGGNPMTCSAIYALIHKLERDGGVWFAKGGTNQLVAGMVALFERLGGDAPPRRSGGRDRGRGRASPRRCAPDRAGAARPTRSPPTATSSPATA